jgi:hypothetical protein
MRIMLNFNRETNNASDLDERVKQLKRGFETPVQGPPDDFGKKLKEATKRRVSGFGPITATTAAIGEETFEDKLREAVVARKAVRALTRKEHEQYVKKEGERYKPMTQRPRTKSD